jgi:hypothetical protein
MTLVIVVGTGIRFETGCRNVCFCTIMRPDEVAATASSWANTQAVAAPMPRTGSVWLDAVCRVPNWVSRSTVALIRPGSTSRNSARSSSSGSCRVSAGLVPACAVPVRRGAATAVTAEADRNARRVEPLPPRTLLFSILRINDVFSQMSTLLQLLATSVQRADLHETAAVRLW